MKKTVIDINDLQGMSPFFRTRFGTFLGKLAIRWFRIDRVNRVHENSCHLRGADFTSGLLSDPLIDLNYRIHNEEILDTLPEGAFVTVSNHPIGSLDGIILIDIFARRRPDFKVMVNGFLTNIGAMADNFISVVPEATKTDPDALPSTNINGVRLSLQRLKEGHPMGFFPAGAVSMYNKERRIVTDLPWTHSVVRLARKARVPIYPVLFDFYNTRFFYFLGTIDWRIRSLRMPWEAFNKRGRTVDVYIGQPVMPEEIEALTDEALAEFLNRRTYALKK
ncbi:lysophospholipid acyltransferase family protein [Parabacteroides sp. PF5-6]|uniref:lysophospholipid acyltransferase family protein n=1 Tax=Parabacteroides sp. PF5-6 TaxID=1742403 RepID=UPI0024063D57|nr:lysophospholipid acyltransferase family protein [Parabacteroides sp. PF5-6]MDF9831686.1 putative hemolysin [Parabacteroides sp. PF5-6]